MSGTMTRRSKQQASSRQDGISGVVGRFAAGRKIRVDWDRYARKGFGVEPTPFAFLAHTQEAVQCGG